MLILNCAQEFASEQHLRVRATVFARAGSSRRSHKVRERYADAVAAWRDVAEMPSVWKQPLGSVRDKFQIFFGEEPHTPRGAMPATSRRAGGGYRTTMDTGSPQSRGALRATTR